MAIVSPTSGLGTSRSAALRTTLSAAKNSAPTTGNKTAGCQRRPARVRCAESSTTPATASNAPRYTSGRATSVRNTAANRSAAIGEALLIG